MLLAAAVLAVAATVILTSISSSLRASRSSENVTRATFLLQEKAAQIAVAGVDAPTAGDFGDNAPDFKWRIIPAKPGCGDPLCPVSIFVDWKERGNTNSIAITTYATREKKKTSGI
jgi:hypothetical protein